MKSAADLRAAALAWLPLIIVTLFGLYLLWPVPAGVMPLSADHTVHLTRAYLYGEQLAGGHLVGWSPAWFFGFPLGELYPVLGDLGVLAVRVITLGQLDWPQCYALLFTLVFLAQGWVLLRCGRAIGWGPLPGLVAALLMLADVGAYREGGWIYTVTYGVWPQALATSLAWLAFAELARATPVLSASPAAPVPKASHGAPVPKAGPAEPAPKAGHDAPVPPTSPAVPAPRADHDAPVSPTIPAEPAPKASPSARPGRPLALAALAAAGALLAHPMALMMLAFGAPLWLLTVGLRGVGPDLPASARRDMFAGTARHLLVGLGLGLALAAWWLLPMTAHRGWMASYGWLHASLADMLRWAGNGAWAQQMPAAVGHCALLGLALAAVRGRGPLRFFALWTALHWLLASTDLFWTLRLDWLSAAFSHIQYQRFLIAAKPGIFLLAGAAVGGLAHLAVTTWPKRQPVRSHVHTTVPHAPAPTLRRRPLRPPVRRALAGAAALAALALAAWQFTGVRAAVVRHKVGEVQTERVPGDPGFAAHYAELLAWARARWDDRTGDYRIAVRADRNAHWFMDSPVTTRTPTYKQGFTPGDNFVHKPESGDRTLLRRLGVRYLLGAGIPAPPDSSLAARFGDLRVFELHARDDLARLEPGGHLTVEHADLTGGRVRVRVDDAPPGARLIFHIAGYPRWDLSFQPADGGPPEPVEWIEVPVIGDGPPATQADRREGRLRGGKALGDDGREPTLIAAPARPGVYTLEYARWRRADILGLGLTLAGLAALVALARARRDPLARLHAPLRRLAHPALVAAAVALLLALAVVRHRAGAARERDLASARLARGDAVATRMIAGPLKTDMLIFPAVVARPDRSGVAEVVFPRTELEDRLTGWYALDDDDAKQRRRGNHRLAISARPAGGDAWTTLLDINVAHRPDRSTLDSVPVPPDLRARPVDVRVVVTSSGDHPPRLGLDLRLP